MAVAFIDICPACWGEGNTIDDLFRCFACNGTGIVSVEDEDEIDYIEDEFGAGAMRDRDINPYDPS